MSEHNRSIITIGRQFGSGGREIGEKLAKELSIPFYDKELIALAGQRSGIDQSLLDAVGCVFIHIVQQRLINTTALARECD